MATISNLTSGTSAVAGPWSTASVSPASNNLILLTVGIRNGASTNPADPTVSGNGLTWVKVNSVNFDNNSSSRRTVFVFRALGASPSSGAITITPGETDTNATWSVDQISGVNTGGTNGSAAVVQSVTNFLASGAPNTTLVGTLAAFSSTFNATFGAFANDDGTGWSIAAGSGFTQSGIQNVTGVGVFTEFKSTNDTTVDATFISEDEIGVIAIEIAASPTSASASVSPSASISPSASLSPSASASASLSPSASVSPSSSASRSLSPSASVSPSASISPSASASASLSPSASISPSASASASFSPSASVSPSASFSPSASASMSLSPSASASASLSPSSSLSPSASTSPSLSPSASVSPSAAPPEKEYISLVEAESDWYITRSSLRSDAPLVEHQKHYWATKGIITYQKSLLEIEKAWLRSVSGSTSDNYAELWRFAMSSQGYTPFTALNANKFAFYSSVTSNP